MKLSAQAGLILFFMLSMLAASPLLGQEAREIVQMRLTSPLFMYNTAMPDTYTCNGDDVSPPLVLEYVPAEAKSLAVIVDDPDAPGGSWVHWVLWNIDPATRKIDEGSVPRGAKVGLNSWKKRNYRGPCPPSGTHHYFFRLYALDQRLNLPASTTGKDLDQAMQGKILARTTLVGVYRHR